MRDEGKVGREQWAVDDYFIKSWENNVVVKMVNQAKIDDWPAHS